MLYQNITLLGFTQTKLSKTPPLRYCVTHDFTKALPGHYVTVLDYACTEDSFAVHRQNITLLGFAHCMTLRRQTLPELYGCCT
jgi:hypothetical protein